MCSALASSLSLRLFYDHNNDHDRDDHRVHLYCGDDDNDDDTQALALLLANTTNTIDSVVDKITSKLHIDIKDHQTVVVFSVIR